jgi:hypothetical protein
MIQFLGGLERAIYILNEKRVVQMFKPFAELKNG